MCDLPKLAGIIANEQLVNHLVEYGYAPPITLPAFSPMHATRPITLASYTSATRMMLSISPQTSSHSAPSAPSGKTTCSSTAASLLLGTTPQDLPSALTTLFRSTRNQRGNRNPILATVRLYCILQCAVFDCRPFTSTSTRLADAGI
jgi:hypothetical protein